jgi:hypothetical protein
MRMNDIRWTVNDWIEARSNIMELGPEGIDGLGRKE